MSEKKVLAQVYPCPFENCQRHTNCCGAGRFGVEMQFVPEVRSEKREGVSGANFSGATPVGGLNIICFSFECCDVELKEASGTFDWKDVADERCKCGHRKSKHHPQRASMPSEIRGKAYCAACSCTRFTWVTFILRDGREVK